MYPKNNLILGLYIQGTSYIYIVEDMYKDSITVFSK